MPFKMYANNVGKQTELFSSSHQKFKAFNLETKMPPHLVNDWHFETGDTASKICGEEKKHKADRSQERQAHCVTGCTPTTKACTQHLMLQSIRPLMAQFLKRGSCTSFS